MPNLLWCCKKCNRGYTTREDAQACEVEHATPEKIKYADHRSHYQCHATKQRYPKTLLVEFDSGKVGVYRWKELHYTRSAENEIHRTGNSDAGRHPQGPGKFPSPEPERRENLA
jgi:hypothetical protein